MTGKQFGTVAVVGAGGYLLATVALHFLDTSLSVTGAYVSDYALGDYGWLSRASDFSAAVGLMAIALGLRATLVSGKRVTPSWVLIFLGGLGFVVSGLFATDGVDATEMTVSGVLHAVGGMVSILGLVVTAWMLRGVFSRDAAFGYLGRAQSWFAVALTVTAVASIGVPPVGVSQRVFIAAMVTWWLALGVSLRRSGTAR